MDQAVVPPDADVHGLIGLIWDKVEIDVFAQGRVGNLDLVGEE